MWVPRVSGKRGARERERASSQSNSARNCDIYPVPRRFPVARTIFARRGLHSGRRPAVNQGQAGRSSIDRLPRFWRLLLLMAFFLPSPQESQPGPTATQDAPPHSPPPWGAPPRGRMEGGPLRSYYLRCKRKERAPGDQHRITPNAYPTAPWPMGPGWGVSGDNLCATFMPRLCVYGRLLAPPGRGAATGIGL